jgi:hypothetical protein
MEVQRRQEYCREDRDGMCYRDQVSMILQFLDGLRGDVHVTFEEGTCAA